MTRTIYGFYDLGRKIPIGSYEAKPLVGGIIFYIDSTAYSTGGSYPIIDNTTPMELVV